MAPGSSARARSFVPWSPQAVRVTLPAAIRPPSTSLRVRFKLFGGALPAPVAAAAEAAAGHPPAEAAAADDAGAAHGLGRGHDVGRVEAALGDAGAAAGVVGPDAAAAGRIEAAVAPVVVHAAAAPAAV